MRIMNSTAGLMIWRVDPGAAQLVDRSYELSLKYLEPSHYEALAARDNRYDLSVRRGRVEAIAEYERLARDCGGWLGRDDGLTLHVRSNLAFRLVQFEQLDEAIRRYKKLADDFRRVYGSESPEFLAVRGHLAAARAKTTVASDLRLAISEFESLVKDFALTQGADHPNTLRTRFNLIRAKELLLPPGDALVLLAGLVDDFDRVQGSDHIDTLIARARLAELTVVSGSGVEGLQRFDALVEDVRRDYGIDHPFTLMFRQRAAICRGEAIGPLAALGASTTLIEDYERVLGSDCADTINARGQEAQWVAQSGAVSDAIDLYAKIIEDSQLYLGADHLHTLAAREIRASWLVAMAGATEADRQQAIQELEEVLQDYRRVFGSSNPNTARVEALLIKARQRVAGSDDSRTRPAVRPSRNDPCWCGSGQKFKRCHGSR